MTKHLPHAASISPGPTYSLSVAVAVAATIIGKATLNATTKMPGACSKAAGTMRGAMLGRIAEAAADADRPVLVVAHSFGCLATVRAINVARANIRAALLVAPVVPHRFGIDDAWVHEALAIPSLIVASDTDPWLNAGRRHCSPQLGVTASSISAMAGHINVASGFGKWPECESLAAAVWHDAVGGSAGVPAFCRCRAIQEKELGKVLMAGVLAAGYPTERWTLPRIGKLIAERFGVEYSTAHLWHLLRRMGFSCKKPEKRAIQRNKSEIVGWKRRGWPALKKHEIANLCLNTIGEVGQFARNRLKSMQQRPTLITAFWQQAELAFRCHVLLIRESIYASMLRCGDLFIMPPNPYQKG